MGRGTPSPLQFSIVFSYKIRRKTYTSRGCSDNRKFTDHLFCLVTTVLDTGDIAGSMADIVPAVKGLMSHGEMGDDHINDQKLSDSDQ